MQNEPTMNFATATLLNSFIKSPVSSIGFSGPGGSGKLRIARYLCSKVLSVSQNQLDFRIETIDCAGEIGIDDIRALKRSLAIKSTGQQGSFSRAVIFDNFNKISIPAQNSILKLLEEPPKDTLLVVLVDTKNNILSTIISRLQWIEVLPISLKTLEKKYSRYDKVQIKQSYLLSNGYLISFEKMLDDEKNPLKQAVDEAKNILKLKKIDRLANVEKILKSQDYSLEDFMTALQKIYFILLHREAEGNKKLWRRTLLSTEQVNISKESLKYNANSKLVLTNLLYKI